MNLTLLKRLNLVLYGIAIFSLRHAIFANRAMV